MNLKKVFSIIIIVALMAGCTANNVKKVKLSKNQNVSNKEYNKQISSFDEFYRGLLKEKIEYRKDFIKFYFKDIVQKTKFPIIEGNKITFVYYGNVHKVTLVGDINDWGEPGYNFKRVKGTNLFLAQIKLDIKARVEYKFIINDSGWIMDPLNTEKQSNGMGGSNSIFKMDNRAPKIERKYNKKIAHGKTEEVKSKEIKRAMVVYLPPEYSKNKKYKVAYFQDGSGYLEYGDVKNILDYMIENKEIEPIVGVFIDAVERAKEYSSKDNIKYVDEFVNIIVPYVEQNYSVGRSKEDRILVGASAGANISAYIAYKHADMFGYFLSQSGAYNECGYFKGDHGDFENISGEAFALDIDKKKFPLKVFLSTGIMEIFSESNKWIYNELKKNKTVKGVKFVQHNYAHNWSQWGDTLREGFIWLIGNEKDQKEFELKKSKRDYIKTSVNIVWEDKGLSRKMNAKNGMIAISELKKPIYEYKDSKELFNDLRNIIYYKNIIPNETTVATIKTSKKDMNYAVIYFYDTNSNKKMDINEYAEMMKTINYKLDELHQYEVVNDVVSADLPSIYFENKGVMYKFNILTTIKDDNINYMKIVAEF
ncbi:alpha/beta hydrolase-fold protein [Haliovirga abyssi]|uniref:Uncharacterized protein n=1 Tax=Haliovirga abyssi TaxID=2996794 RepID=A0AAU9DNI2_9FUSO|nr:alpha/beta hydrolase-fold protein [Haliovirga abyssi]BDU51627.1 hypothetical protein HLVA_21960 [Haliovirga abyssi]